MLDTLIKNCQLVDGTGSESRSAAIGIENGLIKEIYEEASPDVTASEQIDAGGQLTTPGFVDVHTHYDGQATWDDLLAPSAYHGVTTAIMGNCGVGFAPVRPDAHQFLVELMEGVEDIPGSALADGIKWSWESFPEYLDALDATQRAISIATQVPHGALRAYVFGDDANVNAPASAAQIADMAVLASEAVQAGALSFSSNRIPMHTSVTGEPVPGTFAEAGELVAILNAVKAAGSGLVQVVPAGLMGEDPDAPLRELELYRQLSLETGCTIAFLTGQNHVNPDMYHVIMEQTAKANAEGASLCPSISPGGGGLLMSWDTFNPFADRPSYVEIAELPLVQRIDELCDPKRRARILAEPTTAPMLQHARMILMSSLDCTFAWGHVPVFEPEPEASLAYRMEQNNQDADSAIYDALCEATRDSDPANGQPGFLKVFMSGYKGGDFRATEELLKSESTVIGSSDGGAHVNVICDASYPSFMLQHWVRDRNRGAKLSVEEVVKMMTSDPASLYGLHDRGTLRSGMRADLNIIDLPALSMKAPKVVNDLPSGAPRLMQRASGYSMTMVAGQATFIDDQDTGNRPGTLFRLNQ
ncbi:MAG: amidohydrolase family protein [Pseudomonadales bacterium]